MLYASECTLEIIFLYVRQLLIYKNSLKSLSCACHVILGACLHHKYFTLPKSTREIYISSLFRKVKLINVTNVITKTNKFTPRLTGDSACIMFFYGLIMLRTSYGKISLFLFFSRFVPTSDINIKV